MFCRVSASLVTAPCHLVSRRYFHLLWSAAARSFLSDDLVHRGLCGYRPCRVVSFLRSRGCGYSSNRLLRLWIPVFFFQVCSVRVRYERPLPRVLYRPWSSIYVSFCRPLCREGDMWDSYIVLGTPMWRIKCRRPSVILPSL